jgi:excisionase family DNA binding protein
MNQPLLSTKQVAKELSVTDQHIRGLIKQGFLKAIKIGKRAYRISRTELDRFILERTSN